MSTTAEKPEDVEVHELQIALDNLRSEASSRDRPLDLVKASESIDTDADELSGQELTLQEIMVLMKEPDQKQNKNKEDMFEEPITDKQALAGILDFERHSLENGLEIPCKFKQFLDQRRSDLRVFLASKRKQTRIHDFFGRLSKDT